VDDQSVLVGILVTIHILFTLIRIFAVAHLIQAGERLSLDTSAKARSRFRNRARRRSLWLVLELRVANLSVRLGEERLGDLGVRPWLTERAIIFTWIDVGVTKCVASEVTESCFSIFATVDSHGSVLADFVALLAESLVVCAGVTNSEAHRHRKEGVTLL